MNNKNMMKSAIKQDTSDRSDISNPPGWNSKKQKRYEDIMQMWNPKLDEYTRKMLELRNLKSKLLKLKEQIKKYEM